MMWAHEGVGGACLHTWDSIIRRREGQERGTEGEGWSTEGEGYGGGATGVGEEGEAAASS
jgi:hypothetical protein